MTPLIFHAIDFSAREVGSGLAVSALIGTVVRLLSGALLDRGIRCSWPVRGTTLLAIAADLILLQANSYNSYLLGQLLLGCAAGLYWPAFFQPPFYESLRVWRVQQLLVQPILFEILPHKIDVH